ncbi:signal recognition particle-docking protein FtsY [Rickettsia amblyommatis]|uniref:Signal recognition particle receptor FtsY n=2 Tax=Rickettsia amblyommatis TaxID=33989 RepID=H8K324_RICAG|nr:signal recognition particle-docking protein FtsY [Rickettsia amblyommatis]AFC70292.1 signal recognition particle-docking protein FtsY [Rickettsia amblyommatis str. GAT-30V]ALA62231.1 cell division protein FtsY [Rickettsia amblyommatis]ARD87294.1 signal recognition particle-docking protein FtsY [Rickettsia amblyommatis]KJV61127.1 signal recognition particle-docking protein FtsY [Rickettsia amblyommatis str. Ac/Pa]KJV88812.1 signal recognition particle-docking protein FtsY [Rickettsia amblyom
MISIFSKLKQSLSKTSNKISEGIDKIFYKKKLDAETLEELEELLISSDMSVSVVTNIIEEFKKVKFDKEIDSDTVKEALAKLIAQQLSKSEIPFTLSENKLNVILVCGVNGAGKTTTIGKLAALYSAQGKKVAVTACDTFRAAAVNQLSTWADRANALLITGEKSADPASVAYRGMEESIKQNIDILFIDTAGRLHNKKNLMDELSKIVKVIKKLDKNAPTHSVLVMDAITGQNTYNQVEHFNDATNLTGLIVTKLDGSAKAGVIVGVVQKFNLPLYFIGIGEKIEDLKIFNRYDFARSLVGL